MPPFSTMKPLVADTNEASIANAPPGITTPHESTAEPI